MIEKDFFMDLELYLCENFGYRDCFSITETCNGCCVFVREKELDLYFRMWEYSEGAKGFNDWTIILTDIRFKTNHEENIL